MTSKLGPRVIGEKEFNKQQEEAAKPGAGRLGPRVLGERVADEDADEVKAKAQALAEKDGTIHPRGDPAGEVPTTPENEAKRKELVGHKTVSPGSPAEAAARAAAEAAATEEDGEGEPQGYATLEDLEKALEADATPDEALAAELARDRPRKGGLELILAAEKAKDEPREDFLEGVTNILEEL